MFNVLVKKHIGSNPDPDGTDGKWRAYYRLIELPFVPSVGMSLSDSGWSPGNLESVHWQQNNGVGYFSCTVKAERPFKFNGYEYSFDYLCEAALGSGWLPFAAEAQLEIDRKVTMCR
jgi:hypothetical protein